MGHRVNGESRRTAAIPVNVSYVSDPSGGCFATVLKKPGANNVGMSFLPERKLLRMVVADGLY